MKTRERYQVSVPIEFRAENALPHKGLTDNIGTGGMCFNSIKHVGEGRNLNICIPSDSVKLVTEATVVWCKRAERCYKIGVKFCKEAPPDLIRSIT